MRGVDAAPVLAVEDGMGGISAPSSKMRIALGWFWTSSTRFRVASGTL